MVALFALKFIYPVKVYGMTSDQCNDNLMHFSLAKKSLNGQYFLLGHRITAEC